MWLHGPCHHAARLALGQRAAQHEPPVLGQHAPVVQTQFGVVAADAHHALGIVGGQGEAVSRLDGQRVDKAVGAAVVVGLESLKLLWLLAVGPCHGLAGGIAWQPPQSAVHGVCLQPVLRGQELDVQTCLAGDGVGHGLVQPHGYLHGLPVGSHRDAAVEVVVVVAQAHFDALVVAIYFAVGHRGHQVPLFGGVVESDGAALHGAHAVVYDLDARVFLVVESSVETVAEYEHVDALPFEIFLFVELQVLCRGVDGSRCHQCDE